MFGSAFLSLLALSSPFHQGDATEVQGDYSTWLEILRLADINRTFLLLHQNVQNQAESVPPKIWDKLERQARLRLSVWNVVLGEIGRIESCLRDTGIRWMLIKTIRGFPREIRDLDLLVLDDQLGPLQHALAPLGYVQSAKLSGFKMDLKTYKTIEGYGRVAVTLDVHSRVSYEGITFINEEELWRHHRNASVSGTRVPVPSPEHQMMTTILNSFFGDGGLRLTDVLEYAELLSTGARFSVVSEIARNHGWSLAMTGFFNKAQPYLNFLGVPRSDQPHIHGDRPPTLPAPFAKRILLRALLEKATHDLGQSEGFLVPSWARIAMKLVSRMSRNHLRQDSWNQIFNR